MMDQTVFRDCPRCGNKNSYDLDELGDPDAKVWRGAKPEEFLVECHFCGYRFVIRTGGRDEC